MSFVCGMHGSDGKGAMGFIWGMLRKERMSVFILMLVVGVGIICLFVCMIGCSKYFCYKRLACGKCPLVEHELYLFWLTDLCWLLAIQYLGGSVRALWVSHFATDFRSY